MTDPWGLIEAKQYEEAINEYTRLYQEQGGNFYLNNRGRAYLLAGNFPAALEDFQHIIQISDPRQRSTSEFSYSGICLWYLNRPDEAVAIWRDGNSAPYADAAGGVEIPALLFYGGCRLKNLTLQKEATKLLKKHWQKHLSRRKRQMARSHSTHDDFVHPGLIAWPGAIVPFLLGESDRTHIQQSVERARNDILKQRWQCAADFYMGLQAAFVSDNAAFHDFMKRSAESPNGELEHVSYLARWEVERGFPQPAFSEK